MKLSIRDIVLVLGILSCGAVTAPAAEIENLGANGILSSGASWQGGQVPGPSDIAVWDGAGAASAGGWKHVLGADAAWHGIRTTNCVDDLSITNAGAETLTLGADGIVSGSTKSYIHVPINLSADQIWTLGEPLYLHAPVSGDHTLTARNQCLVFSKPCTIARLNVDNWACLLRDEGSINGNVVVYPGRTLCWHRGLADWSEVLRSPLTNQNGILKFGWFNLRPLAETVLRNGDLICGTVSPNRGIGRIELDNGRLTNTGGGVSNNWIYLKTGLYHQEAGTTWIKNGLYAGYDDNSWCFETGSVVRVSGGSLDAWRINIGLGAQESHPGGMLIEGGEVSVLRNENGSQDGIEIAVSKDGNFGISTNRASGWLRMSGGTLNTFQISFGKLYYAVAVGNVVRDGHACVELTGGTMNIGPQGFGPCTLWNTSDDPNILPSAWYDVRMSGGTFGALAPFTNRARTRLSDRHGGLTVRAADPTGQPRDIVMDESLIGSGGFTKTGGGTLYLKAANTYTGRTDILAGALTLGTKAVAPATPVALPSAAAIWVADSLGTAPGTEVTDWPSTNTTHRFTLNVAKAIRSASTAPRIAAQPVGGRAAVAFDGLNNALGLTGLNATPVTGATNLTIALVMRSDSLGQGQASPSGSYGTSVLLSQTYPPNDHTRWRIGYTAAGRLGAAVITNSPGTDTTAVWAPPRSLNDGEPHVMLFTWTANGNTIVEVDGYAYEAPDLSGVKSMTRTRMMMGVEESGYPFRGDIAEVRFYNNKNLSAEQRRQLGLELARAYGAETVGYLSPEEKQSATLASRDIRIASGATLNTGEAGLGLSHGQTISGAGAVNGALRIGEGGVIAVTNATDALTISDLALQPGGVIRWRYDSQGRGAPLQVANLTLPEGVVTLEITSDMATSKPFGTVLNYTGTLTDDGVAWNVVGGHSMTRVEIDDVGKCLKVHTRTGTLITVH
jgi:autotransporter-associated beta strand protein